MIKLSEDARTLDGRHELRREPRFKVSNPVALVFGKDFSEVIHARIENRSVGGALLRIDTKAVLPARFLIVDRTANLFDLAKVAWRRDDKCGVMLVRNFDLSKPAANDEDYDDAISV